MKTVQGPSQRIVAVIRRLNWPAISRGHKMTGNTRIVHDLGIIGDDWDSLYEALRREYGKDFLVPACFMPGEVSHDSAMVASAEGWISRKLPAVQNWYVSRIRCSPLTIDELHELIVRY